MGRAPIWQAFALIKRLPFEPHSMWRAEQLGGMDHFGYGRDQSMIADLIDYVGINTAITAHFGASGKPTFPDPYPRPETNREEEEQETTINDFDIFAVMNVIGGEASGTGD